MWNVVHFLNEDTVEAVPVTWIRGSKCYWPLFSGAKLKSAISKLATPTDDWNIYDIRKIGGTYDNLNKARLKALRAEATSDLNSDADTKRQRKKNRLVDETSDEHIGNDDEETDVEEEIRMPVLSSTNRSIHVDMLPESQTNKDLGKSSLICQESESEEEVDRVLAPQRRDIDKHSRLQIAKGISRGSANSTPTSRSSQHFGTSGTTTPVGKAVSNRSDYTRIAEVFSDDLFKRQVLRQLSVLNTKLDQLAEDVGTILQQNARNTSETEVEDTILNRFHFPLRTIEELNEVELFIGNKDIALKFVNELAKTGGSNCKIMVKRVMTKLFSNDLAMQYSWIGFKAKANFSILAISRIIINAVEKIHRNSTQSEIETAIKLWLVKAKEREKRQSVA